MEKKFRICLLSSVHHAYDTRIFYREAATLSESGYRVTLVAQHNKNEIINNIKIIPVPKFRNRFHRIVIGNWFIFIVSMKEKANLYHFHDPELIPAGLLLKAVGRKVIFDIHEKYDKIILARDYTAPFFRKILSILYKIFIMRFLNYFDYVIPAYDEIKSLLAKFVDAGKIQTVTNYPKIAHFRVTREK